MRGAATESRKIQTRQYEAQLLTRSRNVTTRATPVRRQHSAEYKTRLAFYITCVNIIGG